MPKGSQGRRCSLAISCFFTLPFYAVANKSLARLLWGEKWQIEVIPFSGMLLNRDCLLCLVGFLWISLWPTINFLGMSVFVCVDICSPWTCCDHGDEKKASHPLEPELQTIVISHVDAGIPTRVPWKSSQDLNLTTGSSCQPSGALFSSSIYLTIHSFFVQP